MSAVAFNIAKGREVEFYNNVLTNSPTNSVLTLVVLETGSGLTVDDLVDFDTLAAVLASAFNEVTNGTYARIELDSADLAAWAPDDTGNRIDLGLGIQTWATPAAGDNWDIGLVCYDPDSTGGTDSAIVPITGHELRESGIAIVPDGNPVDWDLSNWISAV